MVDLVLLTLGAALDISVYEVGQAGPMVILLERDPGPGLLAGVSGGWNVMVLAHDLPSELQVVWNVNSTQSLAVGEREVGPREVRTCWASLSSTYPEMIWVQRSVL
jgi:hypothetical protein